MTSLSELKRCKFFFSTINYPGHIIHSGQWVVPQHTIDATCDLKSPMSITDLRLFLGLRTVFRRLHPISWVLLPYRSETCGKTNRLFMGNLPRSNYSPYKNLQQKLIMPAVLAFPISAGTYTLEIDACKNQVGCVILQNQPEGPDKLIRDCLRYLNDAERAFGTLPNKCLALA